MPGYSASGTHAVRMGKVLIAAGLEPVILLGKNQGHPQDLQADGTYKHDGIPYMPVGESNSHGNIFKKFGIFFGIDNPELRYLKQVPVLPFAVIADGLLSFAFLRLRNWCRKNDVVFMPEDAEWNKRADFCGKNMHWLDMEFRMRILQRIDRQIIVNNSFLEGYYTSRGCNVLSMPSMLDTRDAKWMPGKRRGDSSELRLIFTGTPIRDRQDIILGGLLMARREGLPCKIEYVGSTRHQLKTMLPKPELLDELGDAVVFHGIVSFESVPDILAQADYAVLLRDDKRWSRACFPSKVPECLSLGVPMICNLTSDLGKYLYEGREAFLVNELSAKAFADAIHRAMSARGPVREQMGILARKRAEENFDIRLFTDQLGRFLLKAKTKIFKSKNKRTSL